VTPPRSIACSLPLPCMSEHATPAPACRKGRHWAGLSPWRVTRNRSAALAVMAAAGEGGAGIGGEAAVFARAIARPGGAIPGRLDIDVVRLPARLGEGASDNGAGGEAEDAGRGRVAVMVVIVAGLRRGRESEGRDGQSGSGDRLHLRHGTLLDFLRPFRP